MMSQTSNYREIPASRSQRYNRWQGLAIAQTSVAVALLSALSVAGLGTALSLLQNKAFVAALQCKFAFALSFVLFFTCAISCCLVVITRLMDFRLTARTVRKRSNLEYKKSLTIFWLTSDKYGKLTWFFFWCACLSLALASAALAMAGSSAYASILFNNAV